MKKRKVCITKAQRALWRMMALGMSKAEMIAELDANTANLGYHMTTLKRIIYARNDAELVALALLWKVVSVDEMKEALIIVPLEFEGQVSQ